MQGRVRYLLAAALVAIACASAGAQGAGKRKGAKKMSDPKGPLVLTIEAEREYAAGFPMLIAVEIRNVGDTMYSGFRPLRMFQSPGSVSFTVRGGGHQWVWPESGPSMEEEPKGIPFLNGMIWRGLYDLGELHPNIPPGQYELTGDFALASDHAHAAPVKFEVRAPSPADAASARKLRTTNDLHKSSWSAFVGNNWARPDTTGLSPAGHARLAYYLYLHRVAYGPRPIAALDPEEPWQFGQGLMEGEAALLRLEILAAAGKPQAKGIEAAILERWPGLGWRVEEIHSGLGLLTLQRTFHGVESPDAPKGKARPYPPR